MIALVCADPLSGTYRLADAVGIQEEGIRHAYSPRMAMMPWLNSLPSGLILSRIAVVRSFSR